MYNENVSRAEAVKYWIGSAQEDWDVAQGLLKSAKYNHAEFAIEWMRRGENLKVKLTRLLK